MAPLHIDSWHVSRDTGLETRKETAGRYFVAIPPKCLWNAFVGTEATSYAFAPVPIHLFIPLPFVSCPLTRIMARPNGIVELRTGEWMNGRMNERTRGRPSVHCRNWADQLTMSLNVDPSRKLTGFLAVACRTPRWLNQVGSTRTFWSPPVSYDNIADVIIPSVTTRGFICHSENKKHPFNAYRS